MIKLFFDERKLLALMIKILTNYDGSQHIRGIKSSFLQTRVYFLLRHLFIQDFRND